MDLYNIKDHSPEVGPVTVVVTTGKVVVRTREVGEAGQQQEPGTGAAAAQTDDPVPSH